MESTGSVVEGVGGGGPRGEGGRKRVVVTWDGARGRRGAGKGRDQNESEPVQALAGDHGGGAGGQRGGKWGECGCGRDIGRGRQQCRCGVQGDGKASCESNNDVL